MNLDKNVSLVRDVPLIQKDKLYIVTKIFTSTSITYKNLIIKNSKNNTSIDLIDRDQNLEKDDEIIKTVLVTPEDFIIVGFSNDERVHIVPIKQIIKLPTSIIYGHYMEYGCNYNKKITLEHFSYDTFKIIIDSFDDPQILMTKKNMHILQAADLTGLVNSIYCYRNLILEEEMEKKKLYQIKIFSNFVSGKTPQCFCYTLKEYLFYKNYFSADPSIIPIQLCTISGSVFCISVYNGIPLTFGSSSYGSKISKKYHKIYETVEDINKLRYDILFTKKSELNNYSIIAKQIYLDSDSIFSGDDESVILSEEESTECIISKSKTKPNQHYNRNIRFIQEKGYSDSKTSYDAINEFIEAQCDPDLIYNSDEIHFCQGVISLHLNYDNFISLENEIVSAEKYKDMDNAKQHKYPCDLSDNILNMPHVLSYLKIIAGCSIDRQMAKIDINELMNETHKKLNFDKTMCKYRRNNYNPTENDYAVYFGFINSNESICKIIKST